MLKLVTTWSLAVLLDVIKNKFSVSAWRSCSQRLFCGFFCPSVAFRFIPSVHARSLCLSRACKIIVAVYFILGIPILSILAAILAWKPSARKDLVKSLLDLWRRWRFSCFFYVTFGLVKSLSDSAPIWHTKEGGRNATTSLHAEAPSSRRAFPDRISVAPFLINGVRAQVSIL